MLLFVVDEWIDENIAIAMYSVMITVMTFFGGFFFVVSGRVLGEMSLRVGRLRAVWDTVDFVDKALDKRVERMLVRVKRIRKKKGLPVEGMEELRSKGGRFAGDPSGWIGKGRKVTRDIEIERDDIEFGVRVIMILLFGSILQLLVLLMSVGEVGWLWGVGLGWFLFVLSMVSLLYIVWLLRGYGNRVIESVESAEVLNRMVMWYREDALYEIGKMEDEAGGG
jgi:hypothetical protein